MEERRNLYLGDGTHFQLIMSDVNEKEMHLAIREHLLNTERPSHYIRYWEEEGVRWIDYGSWSAFFAWATTENYDKMIRKNKEADGIHG
jgi:hypothetical protein